jgi:hypothetical protein
MPKPGENPALGHLYPDLGFGLVARFSGSCRDDRDPIMMGQFRIGAIDLGLIAVRPMDGGLEIVRDQDLRDAAERTKSPDMGRDPVGQALTPGDLGIGIVGSAEHGEKHLGLVHLTALRVDDGQGLAGIVNKELFAGPVALAHDDVEFGGPGAIGLTKPAILEAIGGLRLVFLPQ